MTVKSVEDSPGVSSDTPSGNDVVPSENLDGDWMGVTRGMGRGLYAALETSKSTEVDRN